MGFKKSGFTSFDVLAFLGLPVLSVFLPLVTFWSFLDTPSPLTFHNVKDDGKSRNKIKKYREKKKKKKEEETEQQGVGQTM